jgi:hypothetical protein
MDASLPRPGWNGESGQIKYDAGENAVEDVAKKN